MIKTAPLQVRNEIVRPDVNYRELEALNCSMIKLYDGDPIKFYEQFMLGRKRKESTSSSILIGDLVDFYILECRGSEDEFENRFDEKYALFEDVRGTAQVFTLADVLFSITQKCTDRDGKVTTPFAMMFTEAFNRVQESGLYRGKSENKVLEDFYDNGYDYYQSLVDNVGKILVDISIVEKAKRVANILLNDEFTRNIFEDDDNIEYFPKFPIEWTYKSKGGKEVKCKSEIDVLKIDHKNKRIYVGDCKTTFDNENFEFSYIKYKYYLQAAFYDLAVKTWTKDEGMEKYNVLPMEFIVGDTSSNNRRPVRFKLTSEDISAGMDGFHLRGTRYKGINQLIEEILWCQENNTWNCGMELCKNNGILPLNINYDRRTKV